jgi:hypothetical protein
MFWWTPNFGKYYSWGDTKHTPLPENKLCLVHFLDYFFLPFLHPAWFYAEMYYAVLLDLHVLQAEF